MSQKLTDGDNFIVLENILIDGPTPSFHDVTINAGASLTFDPSIDLTFRAANIYVDGSLEIGSEDCPYLGRLEITLTGKKYIKEIHVSTPAFMVG